MNKFSTFSNWVSIADLGTNLSTLGILYSRGETVKKGLVYASIGMSVIALGASIIQTKKIIDKVDEVKTDVRDQIIRNTV